MSGRSGGRWPSLMWHAATPSFILLGLCLRLYRLADRSLWLDESLCIKIAATQGFANLLHEVTLDIHPPLFYVFLHFWIALFGNTDLAVRLVSVTWGCLGMVGVFFLCRYGLNWDQGTSNLAVLLTAVLPLHVYYSQEVRPYAVWFALGTFALGYLFQAHRKARMHLYLIFGLIQSLLLYTHHIALIYCAALNVVYLVLSLFYKQLTRTRIEGWVASGIVTALMYSPWLPFFWNQLHKPTVTSFLNWAPKPSLVDLCLVFVKITGVWELDPPFDYPKIFYILAVVPIWLLMAWGVLYALKEKRTLEIVLAVFIVVYPSVIFFASYSFVPIWFLKLFLPSTIGVPVIAALGMKYGYSLPRLRWLSSAIMAFVILIGLSSSLLWVRTYKKDDWKGAGQFLSNYLSEDDAILVYREYNVCALERYIRPGLNIIGVRRQWKLSKDLTDNVLRRKGIAPKRVILALSNSDNMSSEFTAAMQTNYRIAEKRIFYHVSILVFCPRR